MGFKREGNDLVEGANRLRRIIMVEGGGRRGQKLRNSGGNLWEG